MALFQTTFYSRELQMNTSVTIIVPSDWAWKPEGGFPAVYLLHGMGDDHTIWMRNTRIERYASDYQTAVIMPQGHLSFYCDMAYGGRFFSYITEELPEFINRTFPVNPDRSRNFIAGLSMGGFGAIKAGLSRPDRFGATAGLSSVIFPKQMALADPNGENYRLMKGILGENLELTDKNDLVKLAEEMKKLPEEQRTRLYMAVGTNDFLYVENQKFRKELDALGLPYIYEEGEGTHSWDFWDEYVQHVLKFFFGK